VSTPHPTYAKPTIVEATCEIAFVGETPEPLTSRALYPLYSDEFPEIAPIGGAMSLQVIFQQIGGVSPTLPVNQARATNVAGFKFSTATGDRFVQMTKSTFQYSLVGAPYSGWIDFKGKLVDLWSKSQSNLKPQKIVKMGLRYINRIAKEANHPHLADWLRASEDMPAALINSKGHFLARIETMPAPNNLKLVTVADSEPDATFVNGAIVLDIDRVCTESFEVSDTKVNDQLENLHNDVWDVFANAKTSLLDSRLNGE
jgi:uncharacterized protein (TIGR04255 family)